MNTHSEREISASDRQEMQRAPGSPSPALSASSCCFFLCISCNFLRNSSCCFLALSWAACNWSHCFLSSSSCCCRSSSRLCFLKLRKHRWSGKWQKKLGHPSEIGSALGDALQAISHKEHLVQRRLGFPREPQLKGRGKNTVGLELEAYLCALG